MVSVDNNSKFTEITFNTHNYNILQINKCYIYSGNVLGNWSKVNYS